MRGTDSGAPRRDVDALIAGYAAVAGVALLFPNRSAGWLGLLLAHVALIGGAVIARRYREHATGVIGALLDWYPLALLPPFYAELDTLNRAVHGGVFFDGAIQRIEAAIFGFQPSVEWARAMPEIVISEPLHAAYIAYYLIIYLPPIWLFLRGRRREFRTTVFVLLATFIAHYVFFIYLPVQGPRYIFPAPTGGIENGVFYHLAHWILEAGSSQGAAFPSSHVGVSVAQCVLLARFIPRIALPTAIITAGLAAGAVYGGFHYATDAIVGAALGGAIAWWLLRREPVQNTVP